MSKRLEHETDIEIIEMVEVVSFDDIDIEDDIREWLQTPPVELKQYGFGEADGEEEYYALLNELSDFLMER